MSEIEKMYENAKLHKCSNKGNFCKHIGEICEKCKKHKYPPFIAEKQLELIKWLSSIKDFEFESVFARGLYIVGCRECVSNNKHWAENKQFEEALAELINDLWQDLTDAEKAQIKEILK